MIDKQDFNNYLRLLSENLDYLFLAIAILFALLIISAFFPSRGKRLKLKGELKPDKARKKIQETASEMERLLGKYEERILYYEQLEQEKKERIQGLELAIAERDEALRNLEGAPAELKKVLAKIDTSGKPKRRGSWASFFWGLFFGIFFTAIGVYSYFNWEQVKGLWENIAQ